MTRTIALAAVAAALLALAPAAAAQSARPATRSAVGVQLGSPTGISARFGGLGGWEAAAAWDLDDFFFVQAHKLLVDRRVADLGGASFYAGPGAALGVRQDDAAVALSGVFGLGYWVAPEVELFGQLTPRLELAPATDVHLGAGVGVRFWVF